jgi:hypothetical protein
MATPLFKTTGVWTTAAAKATLTFGELECGTTSAEQELWIWNGFPTRVTDEAVGTGDGETTAFSLDNANVCSPCLVVYLDGVAATSGVDYTPDYTAGTVTFLAGHIPASAVVITATYLHTAVAGGLSTLYLLARRKIQMLGTGNASLTLPIVCSRVFEVFVGGIAETGWTFTAGTNVLAFSSAPALNAQIVVYAEDETATEQVFRVRSVGIADPYGGSGMSSDSEISTTAIGGIATVAEWEDLGVGDGETMTFETAHAPLIVSTVQAKVGDVTISNFSVSRITGVITLEAAPDSSTHVYAKYSYDAAHQIGAITAGCGRQIYVKAVIPVAPTLAAASAELEVLAV